MYTKRRNKTQKDKQHKRGEQDGEQIDGTRGAEPSGAGRDGRENAERPAGGLRGRGSGRRGAGHADGADRAGTD